MKFKELGFGARNGYVVSKFNAMASSSVMMAMAVKEEPVVGAAAMAEMVVVEDVDKDFVCPICLQTMQDAFLTSCCGHSFCHSCISTHLSNKSNCPSCSRYLTADQLIPNFLLSKVSPFIQISLPRASCFRLSFALSVSFRYFLLCHCVIGLVRFFTMYGLSIHEFVKRHLQRSKTFPQSEGVVFVHRNVSKNHQLS